MITSSYGLTATERVLPRLALDFTTAVLDPRVTITRTGNNATVTNSSGVIVGVNANLPRFDFNPTTLVCNGLLIEESRTNLLLNSLIDGTNLTTQLVTTTAVSHTLSFYGTGTIVLTGTSSATVVGTGAYPARQTLTFTPTAGVLTLTVTGTVQFAQLEVGAFATSFIPTAASQVTRTADVATMTGTNFSDWYNQSQGSFKMITALFGASASKNLLYVSNGAVADSLALRYAAGLQAQYTVTVANVTTVSIAQSGFSTLNTIYTRVASYKLNGFAQSINATLATPITTGAIPTVNQLIIGTSPTFTGHMCGYVRAIYYWPQYLVNAETQAFSK